MQLHEARDRLADAGVTVVAIAPAAAHQARWLRDERGIEIPMLLDPEDVLRAAAGADRLPLWTYLSPAAWWRYLRGLIRFRPGTITASPTIRPALAIVDGDRNVRWRHVGRTVGDYPDVDEVISRAIDLAKSDRSTDES